MANPLVLRLEHAVSLTADDRRLLEDLAREGRRVGPREDLIREEDPPEAVYLVLDGFACRYKTLPDGRRSITAYLVPGDFCNLHVTILGEMDHTIGTLAPCTIVEIEQATIHDLTCRSPRIARALWWSTLVDEGTLREWLVSLGKRPADRQLAHLLCELRLRLLTVGKASSNSYSLPLTQEELADSMGITPVHVNRVLQQLREDGLIRLQDRMLTVPDIERLEAFAGFNPNYLHLREKPGRLPADERPKVTA